MTHKKLLIGPLRVVLALIAMHASVALGDSLHLAADHAEIHPYDLVSVTLALTVDAAEGAVQFHERDERGVPIAIARRRFRAFLRDETNTIISTTPIFREWNEWITPRATESLVFECKTIIGFFVVSTHSKTSSSDLTRFVPSGTYSIVVMDEENSLESNPVQIDVLVPDERGRVAADVLLREYPEAIKLIMDHEASNATVRVFQELAAEYPDTDLGRLAILALALQQGKAITNKHGGAPNPRIWKPIADDIAAALESLPANHPLRAEALFELSAARARSMQPQEAEAAVAKLQKLYPKRKWAQLGRRLPRTNRR